MANTQPINVGKTDNDKTGDPLRVAMQKVNANFTAVQADLASVWNAAPLGASIDLNTITAPGRYHQHTNANAQTGSNYPVANAGLLEVAGSTDSAFVYQEYTQYRSGAYSRRFWRSFYGGIWAAWQELPALSQKGAANGLAALDANGKVPIAQIPAAYSAALPTTAHDLNDYITPGSFYQTTIAGATAGVNYPVVNVGFLEVTATGTPVVQVFTTRTNVPTAMQRFWRVRMSATVWSAWKELADVTTVVSYAGGMVAAQDLNSYTQRGLWAVGTSAIAAGGSNFPVGQSGYLLVMSGASLGGPVVTSGVCQVYYAGNGNKVYNRSLITGNWSPWVASVDSSQIAAPGGVATLDGSGRIPLVQIPPIPYISLTETHDLNAAVLQGDYYVPTATITGGSNLPIGLTTSAIMNVAAYGNAVRQSLTAYGQDGESWWRMRQGPSTWGPWRKQVDFSQTLTRTTLEGSAVDVNTLIRAEQYYVFNASVMSSGKNFPPCIAVGGAIYTSNIGPSNVVQTAILNFGNANQNRPAVYRRRGGGSPIAWGAWTIAEPLSLVNQLPTADCGDVQVDGLGRYRWNGTAYAKYDPSVAQDLTFDSATWKVRGAMGFGPNAGGVFQSSSGEANLNVAPGTAAGGSRLNVWQDNGANSSLLSLQCFPSGARITSGRTGTGAFQPLIFEAVGQECGRINTAATWVIGPEYSRNYLVRQAIHFEGGGTRFGTLYSPRADDTVAIGFSNSAGGLVGSIQTSPSATSYYTTSDYRVKYDVEDMDGRWALASILMMRPRTFKMVMDDSTHDGFIAHELQEVAPLAVSGEKDAVMPDSNGAAPLMKLQGVDSSKLVARMVCAMQEMDRKIESLTRKLDQLRGGAVAADAVAPLREGK